jgi:hypothetical protein
MGAAGSLAVKSSTHKTRRRNQQAIGESANTTQAESTHNKHTNKHTHTHTTKHTHTHTHTHTRTRRAVNTAPSQVMGNGLHMQSVRRKRQTKYTGARAEVQDASVHTHTHIHKRRLRRTHARLNPTRRRRREQHDPTAQRVALEVGVGGVVVVGAWAMVIPIWSTTPGLNLRHPDTHITETTDARGRNTWREKILQSTNSGGGGDPRGRGRRGAG